MNVYFHLIAELSGSKAGFRSKFRVIKNQMRKQMEFGLDGEEPSKRVKKAAEQQPNAYNDDGSILLRSENKFAARKKKLALLEVKLPNP